MILNVYTDGSSKGNPGPSAIGIVCYDNREELFRHREDIGEATNNIAEYMAVIKGLQIVKEKIPDFTFHVSRINFYSDSKLLVSQLNGLYKVKNAKIREMIAKIRMCQAELAIPVVFSHIPREKNRRADKLAQNVA